jgi:hypothetical protein
MFRHQVRNPGSTITTADAPQSIQKKKYTVTPFADTCGPSSTILEGGRGVTGAL